MVFLVVVVSFNVMSFLVVTTMFLSSSSDALSELSVLSHLLGSSDILSAFSTSFSNSATNV